MSRAAVVRMMAGPFEVHRPGIAHSRPSFGQVIPFSHVAAPPAGDLDLLYVVTIRPEGRLWLVGTLLKPTYRDGAYRSESPNNKPIIDITYLFGKLALEEGVLPMLPSARERLSTVSLLSTAGIADLDHAWQKGPLSSADIDRIIPEIKRLLSLIGRPWKMGGCWTPQALADFEKELGFSLPESYRRMLLEIGDGDYGINAPLLPKNVEMPKQLRNPFPLTKAYMPRQEDYDPLDGLPENERSIFESFRYDLPEGAKPEDGCLRIGMDDDANCTLWLVVNGPAFQRGTVWRDSTATTDFGIWEPTEQDLLALVLEGLQRWVELSRPRPLQEEMELTEGLGALEAFQFYKEKDHVRSLLARIDRKSYLVSLFESVPADLRTEGVHGVTQLAGTILKIGIDEPQDGAPRAKPGDPINDPASPSATPWSFASDWGDITPKPPLAFLPGYNPGSPAEANETLIRLAYDIFKMAWELDDRPRRGAYWPGEFGFFPEMFALFAGEWGMAQKWARELKSLPDSSDESTIHLHIARLAAGLPPDTEFPVPPDASYDTRTFNSEALPRMLRRLPREMTERILETFPPEVGLRFLLRHGKTRFLFDLPNPFGHLAELLEGVVRRIFKDGLLQHRGARGFIDQHLATQQGDARTCVEKPDRPPQDEKEKLALGRAFRALALLRCAWRGDPVDENYLQKAAALGVPTNELEEAKQKLDVPELGATDRAWLEDLLQGVVRAGSHFARPLQHQFSLLPPRAQTHVLEAANRVAPVLAPILQYDFSAPPMKIPPSAVEEARKKSKVLASLVLSNPKYRDRRPPFPLEDKHWDPAFGDIILNYFHDEAEVAEHVLEVARRSDNLAENIEHVRRWMGLMINRAFNAAVLLRIGETLAARPEVLAYLKERERNRSRVRWRYGDTPFGAMLASLGYVMKSRKDYVPETALRAARLGLGFPHGRAQAANALLETVLDPLTKSTPAQLEAGLQDTADVDPTAPRVLINRARVLVRLNKFDPAVDLLRTAATTEFYAKNVIKHHADFQPLRSRPDFQQIIRSATGFCVR